MDKIEWDQRALQTDMCVTLIDRQSVRDKIHRAVRVVTKRFESLVTYIFC